MPPPTTRRTVRTGKDRPNAGSSQWYMNSALEPDARPRFQGDDRASGIKVPVNGDRMELSWGCQRILRSPGVGLAI
jgi:hypothetical protein